MNLEGMIRVSKQAHRFVGISRIESLLFLLLSSSFEAMFLTPDSTSFSEAVGVCVFC